MKNICLSFMSGSAVTAMAVLFSAGFSSRMFLLGAAIALGLVGAFAYFTGARKLARFLIAFADGLQATGERPQSVPVPETAVSPDHKEEIIEALVNMGAKHRAAKTAVDEAVKTHQDPEGMLKRAIELMRPTPIKKVA
jgi:hypothetical protein